MENFPLNSMQQLHGAIAMEFHGRGVISRFLLSEGGCSCITRGSAVHVHVLLKLNLIFNISL